jgi:hypothetical protein
MQEQKDGERFVTFKWLIGTVLSIIVIMASFTTIILTSISGKLDSKVDKAIFDLQTKTLCNVLDDTKVAAKEAKETAIATAREMSDKLHQIELLIRSIGGVEPSSKIRKQKE